MGPIGTALTGAFSSRPKKNMSGVYSSQAQPQVNPANAPSQEGNMIPKGYNYGRLNQWSPQQEQLSNQMFSQVAPDSYLAKLAAGDPELFAQMEEPAMRQFAGLQGNIASRFSQQGMGSRKSSGFQNTMGQASQDFAANLQAQRQQLQRQAWQDMMGLSESLMGQRQYDQFLSPERQKKQRQPSFLDNILGFGLPVIGAGVGGFFGGPMGMAAGATLGSSAAQGLRGQAPSEANWGQIGSLSRTWG